MRDEDYVALLQWALPRLGGRWAGYRNVRGQVFKRIGRRVRELGLPSVAAYRVRLEAHPEEWAHLDAMCRVSISRFYRDRALFDALRQQIFPRLADSLLVRHEHTLRVWSAGCASGEEPYTVAIVWNLDLRERCPGVELSCVATEIDPHLLARAERGCFASGTLRELPEPFREAAFVVDEEGLYCVRDELRRAIGFRCQDVRLESPEGAFDLILCRNLAFTYFDETLQREVATRLASRLVPGGVLVLGSHEALPSGVQGLAPMASCAFAHVRT